MTGLIIRKTPELKERLRKLKLASEAKPASSKPRSSAPRVKRFLPGETRATVGAEGFRDLRPDTYGRATVRNVLYGQGGLIERDLNPPRHTAHVNIGGEEISPWSLDCHQKTSIHRLCRQKQGAEYINKFLTSLLHAEYRVWSINGWTYRQVTADTFPQEI
jgi:hypothetical protein